MVGFGFFSPFPLALMLPFMAAQSMLMGDAFGKSFQYGKRKISAMDNDEFNALTPDDLAAQIVTDYKAIIPVVGKAMEDSREFQRLVIREIGNVITDLSDEIFRFLGLDPHFFHPDTPPRDIPPGETPPDETPPEELLDPSFKTVQSWSDTKINLVFARQMHLYTSRAQGFITSEHRRRNKDDVPEPTIPIDELKPKGEFQFTYSELHAISRLHVDSLNKKIRAKQFREVFLHFARLRATAEKTISIFPPGNKGHELAQAQKRQIDRAIVKFNKWLSTSGIKL